MAEDFGAICSDHYVNQRLNLKMDVPSARETVLALFDRVRREYPDMDRFRRQQQELALESDPAADGPQRWVALRRTSLRSGIVNPSDPAQARAFHALTLELAPYYLSISPLDVDYVELLYGFDLLAGGNHDSIVFEALVAGTPLAGVVECRGASVVDCQPIFGIRINDDEPIEAHFEVKTRTSPEPAPDAPPSAISVYLAMRRYGAVRDVADLPKLLGRMASRGEELVRSRLIPNLLTPIREAIASNNT